MDFWCVSLGRGLPVYWHSSDVGAALAGELHPGEGGVGRKKGTHRASAL